jgi:hypothetical protein
MAALSFETQNVAPTQSRLDWGAIWAGMFTFAGIWAVFGFLGIAVFSSTGNLDIAHPTEGMAVGMGIWTIVLTIIAMYVSGLETGRLAAAGNRFNGLLHGLVMFGLSLVGVLVLVTLAGAGMSGAAMSGAAAPTTHTSSFWAMGSGFSWTGFLSLFLGWLAAMSGASVGARRKIEATKPVQPMRTAA